MISLNKAIISLKIAFVFEIAILIFLIFILIKGERRMTLQTFELIKFWILVR